MKQIKCKAKTRKSISQKIKIRIVNDVIIADANIRRHIFERGRALILNNGV